MGLRAFKYQRVSDDRAKGRSVREQERENDRVIERANYVCVGSFTDNDRGASRYSKSTRPAWDEMLERLARGEADVLVTWEASRSTRDLEVYVALRNICRKHGVLWSYNGTEFDLRDGDDSFRTGLDILLAENEVEKTRKRVLRAVQANAERGRPHGKLLEGYTRQYDGTGQFVAQVPYEPEAVIIRDIFARFLGGQSMNSIAHDFTKLGLKTKRGADWSHTHVSGILKNAAFIGKRVYRGEIIGDAVWPALISEADFYRVQAVLNDPERKSKYRRDTRVKRLLTGIAKCGVCGGRIAINKPRGYLSYYCKANFCVARHVEKLDDFITELVIARLERPDIMHLLAIDNEPAVNALDELAALKGRLDAFYMGAAAGEVTVQALHRIEATLLPQIEAAEARARQIDIPNVVHELVANPRAIWQELTIVQKREVINLLMTIRINKSRRGERKLNPEAIEIAWHH